MSVELTMTSWSEFEQGLSRVLRREMTERTTLNLGVRDDVSGRKIGLGFIQREARGGSQPPLIATVFGAASDALDGLDAEAVESIQAADWHADGGHDSWDTSVALPATTADYAALAHSLVVWLRDVGGVESPETLGYSGWRDPLQPMYGPEGEKDPGRSVLYLPQLGISRELPMHTGFPRSEVIPSAELVSILDDLGTKSWPLSRASFDDVALVRGWMPDAASPHFSWVPVDHMDWISIVTTGEESVGPVAIAGCAPLDGSRAENERRAREAFSKTCGRLDMWLGEPVEVVLDSPQPHVKWEYSGMQVVANVYQADFFILVSAPTGN